MQAALEEDALDSAVAFYAEALPVLRKYGHKGAFRGVAVQADAAAKQVSTALKRRLAERKDETEHVVLLLRQLGEGDDTLQVSTGTQCMQAAHVFWLSPTILLYVALDGPGPTALMQCA